MAGAFCYLSVAGSEWVAGEWRQRHVAPVLVVLVGEPWALRGQEAAEMGRGGGEKGEGSR